MLEKVVNGIVAAVILAVGVAAVAIAGGVDTSLVNSLLDVIVRAIISVGVVAIIGAVFYGMGKSIIEA